MRTVVIFAVICAVALCGPHGGGKKGKGKVHHSSESHEERGHGKGPKLPPLPFLEGVSREGVHAFLSLNRNVSRAEFKEEVAAWAEEYNVTEAVEAFETEHTALMEEREANITTVLEALPEAFKELVAIQENMELSFEQVEQEIKALFEGLSEEVAAVLKFIIAPAGHGKGHGHKDHSHESHEKGPKGPKGPEGPKGPKGRQPPRF